jgi:hypothetical protein
MLACIYPLSHTRSRLGAQLVKRRDNFTFTDQTVFISIISFVFISYLRIFSCPSYFLFFFHPISFLQVAIFPLSNILFLELHNNAYVT